MEPYRPLIAIPMRIDVESNRFYLSRYYSEAVEAAGGAPLHIPLIPKQRYISAVVEEVDGVLLPGSDSDVDPLRYGREPHPHLGNVHPERDETDLLLLEAAEQRAVPVLAICFGMQVLNVYRGGTLIQDIASQWPTAIKHEQGPPRDRPSHRVRLLEQSLLASLTDTPEPVVNSHHHQAIETTGRDLIATAWSADGLVEGLEDPRSDQFVVAVQWHPEQGWDRNEFYRALFVRFINEARKHSQTRVSNVVEAANY